MQDLGTLGGELSRAYGVNDLGDVVGYSERAPGGDRILHAVLWRAGEMTDLGALVGFLESLADAINDRGQAVGLATRGAPVFGFLYDPDSGMRDTDALVSPNSGWSRLDPRDINDAGQIVGSGTFRGLRLAFLMTPLDGDFDDDDDTDLLDFTAFRACLTGPNNVVEDKCRHYDINRNGTIDLVDLQAFQWVFGDP